MRVSFLLRVLFSSKRRSKLYSNLRLCGLSSFPQLINYLSFDLNGQIGCPAFFAVTFNLVLLKIIAVTVLTYSGWIHLNCSSIGTKFNGAETNSRIAHDLGNLLMNSNCFAIFFFSSILVMSVQISIWLFLLIKLRPENIIFDLELKQNICKAQRMPDNRSDH